MSPLKNHRLPLILITAMILIQLFAANLEQYLIYQRNEIMVGEWWRLLSGHFIHLGWNHLLMNLAGLAIVWLIADKTISELAWLIAIIGCAVTTSLALLFFSPELIWYVGLSGVLHGLLMVVGIYLIAAARHTGWLILVFVTVKILWEQWAGPSASLESDIGGNVIIDAHLYGALSGVLFAGLLKSIPSKTTETDS